jgi:hypothetical protein
MRCIHRQEPEMHSPPETAGTSMRTHRAHRGPAVLTAPCVPPPSTMLAAHRCKGGPSARSHAMMRRHASNPIRPCKHRRSPSVSHEARTHSLPCCAPPPCTTRRWHGVGISGWRRRSVRVISTPATGDPHTMPSGADGEACARGGSCAVAAGSEQAPPEPSTAGAQERDSAIAVGQGDTMVPTCTAEEGSSSSDDDVA